MSTKNRLKFRHLAFRQQDRKCFYCQLPIWEEEVEQFCRRFQLSVRVAQLLKCTAEHLLAQKDGGKDTAGNIVAACAWCNRRRHHGRHHCAPTPLAYKCRVLQRVAQGKWHPFPHGAALVIQRTSTE